MMKQEKPPPNDLLDWLRIKGAPTWKVSRPLGTLFGAVLAVAVPLLFLFALGATGVIMFGAVRDIATGATTGPNLGTGALVAAILGAPFLIWNTWIKHRALNFQKEGHITDRINKAVEMLGTEKKVDKIGRSVKIYTGKSKKSTVFGRRDEPPPTQPLSIVVSRKSNVRAHEFSTTGETGWAYEVRTWEKEKTIIEWAGQSLNLSDSEQIAETGEWKVFSESQANIEVRSGALMSLERIAQDSTEYDNGRDHVRVMEIICAYVRANAPATMAKNHDFAEWARPPVDSSAVQIEEHVSFLRERFGSNGHESLVSDWTRTLPKPRADISLAINILGRRTKQQRSIERAHAPEDEDRRDVPPPVPKFRIDSSDKTPSSEEYETFARNVTAWKHSLSRHFGYRLDLRDTCLQNAEMSNLDFSGARLSNARMDGATLFGAKLVGADLYAANLEGISAARARFEGANLSSVRLEGGNLMGACLSACNASRCRLDGANLFLARVEGADLSGASLDASNLNSAVFSGSILGSVSLIWSSLVEADFSWANLTSARLEEADTERIERVGAIVTNTLLDRQPQ